MATFNKRAAVKIPRHARKAWPACSVLNLRFRKGDFPIQYYQTLSSVGSRQSLAGVIIVLNSWP